MKNYKKNMDLVQKNNNKRNNIKKNKKRNNIKKNKNERFRKKYKMKV